jgi:3-hydroxymyristoyl/3-hydroxydecanoyl-(acyl carrier protein) dehydratase
MPRRFRLVDALPREENGKLVRERVTALFEDEENRQTIEVRIPPDSPFFRGHFDDYPVLPGVVQVNDLVLRQVRTRWPSLQHLRRVVGLKFKSPIRPGDTLAVELQRSGAGKVQFQISCDGGAVSSGTLVFELEG